MTAHRTLRFLAALCIFGLASPLLVTTTGCSKPAPRAANPTTPISERRAIDVIARAIAKNKLRPAEGREVQSNAGALVYVDVSVEGRKFGVAYQTDNDRQREDADRLPRREKKSNALVLVEGLGKETGAKILVLQDTDYLYDDLVGEEHEQTAIAAERALERDVTDFLVQAKYKKWD